MLIALDLDSTLVNFQEIVIAAYMELFPERKPPRLSEWRHWDMTKNMELSEHEVDFLFRYVRRAGYYNNAAAMDASLDHWIAKLRRDGHEFVIITANPAYMRDTITAWLYKHNIEEFPIIFVDNIEDKFSEEWSVLVDDSPLAYEAAKADDRPLILYTGFHNIECAREAKVIDPTAQKFKLARNFQEVAHHIKVISDPNKENQDDWFSEKLS